MDEDSTNARTRRQLHVLVVAYFCDPTRGSEPGIAWNWIRSLSELCRISVITRRIARPAIEDALAVSPLPNVRFHYLGAPPGLAAWSIGKSYYPRWLQRAGRLGVRLHRSDPFDLAHHLTVATINYPSLLRLPVPLIVGPVGGGEPWPAAFRRGADWSTVAFELLRSFRQRTLRYDPFVRALLGRCSLLFAATPETERLIEGVASRCPVVSMAMAGVERSLVAPSRKSSTVPGYRLYTASRLLGWKGLDLALEAFARVAVAHPEASFTIYGDGPERKTLEAAALRLGISKQVRFAGWLPRDQMLGQTRANGIFVLPSLRDSGGLAVLEAMAAGNPVVCFDTGGPALMVTPESGIRIPVTTPFQAVSDLADAMERLITDPSLVARLGEGARQRVLSDFVWERKAQRMLTHYRSIAP